jgi:hypothetical protein
MTGADAERVAAAVNKLATDLQSARAIIAEDALILLLAYASGIGMSTIKQVLRGIDRLPEKVLTPMGRGIRIRD